MNKVTSPAKAEVSTDATFPVRDILWKGGVFGFRVPGRLQIHQSAHLGHSFARIFTNYHVENNLVSTFLHESPTTQLVDLKHPTRRGEIIFCEVVVWRVVYPGKDARIHLDYIPTEALARSRTLQVVKREHATRIPRHMGGTIISITLTGNVGFILIGDRIESAGDLGSDASQLADVRHQNQ